MVHIIETSKNHEIIDVTEVIKTYIEKSGIESGIIKVSVPHSTASIAIKGNTDFKVNSKSDGMHDVTELVNEDLHHTGVTKDLTTTFVPNSNMALASLIGYCVTSIISKGIMRLGPKQGIYFYEFDGPKTRNINIEIIQG